MRVGIVTDASCDLPSEFLQQHGIGILPVALLRGAETHEDRRDADTTRRFHRGEWLADVHRIRSQALGVEATRSFFVGQLLPHYDYVFCITVGSAYGAVYDTVAKAAVSLLAEQQSGPDDGNAPFALRTIDSKSMLSGPGLLIAEAVRLIAAGVSPLEIRHRLDALRERICVYWVPDDLHELRRRARERGPRRVDWLQATIGTALDLRPLIVGHRGTIEPIGPIRSRPRAFERLFAHIARQIERGIDTPEISVSYGGAIDALHDLPAYALLQAAAARHGVRVLESAMSVAGAVNVGRGCVSIAYAGDLQPLRA